MTSAEMQALVEAAFSQSSDGGLDTLSEPQRVLVCTWALIGEVENGGFDQWLFNSSGDWAKPTITALEALQAHESADLVRRALAIFPGAEPSPHLEDRRLQMQELSAESEKLLSSLDQTFSQVAGGLSEALFEYACRHKPEILI